MPLPLRALLFASVATSAAAVATVGLAAPLAPRAPVVAPAVAPAHPIVAKPPLHPAVATVHAERHASPKIPAFRPPPPDADTATLLATSRALLARQKDRMATLIPKSGYRSLGALADAVSAMGPTHAAAVKMLAAEDAFEFVIRSSPYIGDAIAEKGFLNQYDTGTSGLKYAPAARAAIEASFLGLTDVEYAQLPNSLRPKYGVIRPTRGSGVRLPWDPSEHYGRALFVLKRDAVRDFVTVYPGESLGFSALGWPGFTPPARLDAWHQSFVPWEDRMLLAPSLEVDTGVAYVRTTAPRGFQRHVADEPGYLETQYWRPLGLEHVERYEFDITPPKGEFLQALRHHGVRIIDTATGAEWHGDAPAPLLHAR